MKKVLMIATQEFLNDTSDGGKKCSFRNWKLLQDVFGNENVTLIMYTDKDEIDGNVVRLKNFSFWGERLLNVLFGRLWGDGKAESYIISFLKQNKTDIVFLDRSLHGNLAKKIVKGFSDISIWVFSHNYEVAYFGDKFQHHRVLSFFLKPVVYYSERRTIECAKRVFVLTHRDYSLFERYYGCLSDIIPVSFDDRYDRMLDLKYQNMLSRFSLLFVGSLMTANYEGIKWFVDEVMPRLPDYNLTIVGNGFERVRDDFRRGNVNVIGIVDDLGEYYYSNFIVVLPIFCGAGQKVKTAEAMMYSKIIIATDEALEGYEVDGIDGIYRCNSANEFIRAIRTLEHIPSDEYEKYRKEIRNVFLQNYEYQQVVCDIKAKIMNDGVTYG